MLYADVDLQDAVPDECVNFYSNDSPSNRNISEANPLDEFSLVSYSILKRSDLIGRCILGTTGGKVYLPHNTRFLMIWQGTRFDDCSVLGRVCQNDITAYRIDNGP